MDGVIERVERLDWAGIEQALDANGFATTPAILTANECAQVIGWYGDERRFRSRIVMERLRFGIGEYKYFAAPIPPLVEKMRAVLYQHLAALANRWMRAMGTQASFPAHLGEFLERCHRKGQTKPTPLILRYEKGGYNCLHQDLYGEVAFPLQFTCVLSSIGKDYEGGEFLLVEQRPRAQSRGEAITLGQGEAIMFANSYRPVRGSRGSYRVNTRHGVSRLRAGTRYSLGIIFHDAK